MRSDYLNNIKNQFRYYQVIGTKTLQQVSEKQLHFSPNTESNSIAVIVSHLHGNMASRWTNFIQTDGEKDWRKRDEEFIKTEQAKAIVLEKWDLGWTTLFSALKPLKEEDLTKVISVRNQRLTVNESINKELAHYAYHIGQMVYIGKMLQNGQWKNLSIPKGSSDKYNAQHFNNNKNGTHTDQIF